MKLIAFGEVSFYIIVAAFPVHTLELSRPSTTSKFQFLVETFF